MIEGTPRPLTRDEIKSLMHQFTRSLIHEAQMPSDPKSGRTLVPEIATYVRGALREREQRVEESNGQGGR